MYTLKNSIKNLLRNKMRSLIYIIIVLFMIFLISISILINSSANKVLSKYKQGLGDNVEIKFNPDKIVEGALSGLSINDYSPSTKDYFKFSDSKYVKEAIFTGSMRGYIEGLKEEKNEIINSQLYEKDNDTNSNIIGYTPINNKYKLSQINIKQGKMFENNNECIVSSEFLNYNNRNIGDEISVLKDLKGDINKKLKLKIVGVYEIKLKENNYTSYEDDNTILTTYKSLSEFEDKFTMYKPTIYTKAQFILKDSNSREKFDSELRNKGLKDTYKLAINENEYNKVITPIEALAKLSSASIYITLFIGLILLTIIFILYLKDKKYEVVVFRSIGISKFELSKGYLYEGIIITIICLFIGIVGANVLAQPIANNTLKNQTQMTQEINTSTIEDEMPFNGLVNIYNNNSKTEIKNIRVTITQDSIVKIIVSSIFISFLISMMDIYIVIKYKPEQILYDRN